MVFMSKRAKRRQRGRHRVGRQTQAQEQVAAQALRSAILRLKDMLPLWPPTAKLPEVNLNPVAAIAEEVGGAWVGVDLTPFASFGVTAVECGAAIRALGSAVPSSEDIAKLFGVSSTPPVCRRCRNYQGVRYGHDLLHCAMHPYGPESEQCEDWETT